MQTANHKLYVMILFVLCLAASCGGGGDLVAGGGIGGTGVTSSGTITAIGSIWVNGTRFDTAAAEVFIDGDFQGSGDQTVGDRLDPGRVVLVNGYRRPDGSGHAETVTYSSLLLGQVEALHVIDDQTTEVTILGQNAVVDARTRLKNLSMDALALGELVEISGFLDDTGRLQATFMTRPAPAQTLLRLSGPVMDWDPATATFFIQTQKIDCSRAEPGALPLSQIREGLLVSVSGNFDDDGIVIIAATLDRYARLGAAASQHIEIEGLAGSGLEPAGDDRHRFTMEGYVVEITPATTFVGGSVDDLLAGVRIEVEGQAGDGVIVAARIKFHQLFRAESNLAAKDDDTGTLTLAGLEGLTITTNLLTRFQGLADGFEQLNAGDHLVIKGWPTSDGQVTASQIIGLPSIPRAVLRATVSAVDDPLITIGGVAVDTSLIPSNAFFLDDDVPISRESFFDRVAPGDWVALRGELLNGDPVLWNTITLVGME